MKNRGSAIILLSILMIVFSVFIMLFIIDLVNIQNEKAVKVLSKKDTESSTQKGNTYSDIKLPDSTDQSEVASKQLDIVAVGDILLGRTVKDRIVKKKERYQYPFLKVASLLKSGDVVFGNLEESITDSAKSLTGIHEGGKYVLKNDSEAIEGIKYAGFNLLSLANNHILDYYETGLLDTERILASNNIVFAGAGKNLEAARKLSIIEKNGITIGLLAYTDMANIYYKGNPPLRFLAGQNNSGVAPVNKNYILEDIDKAKGRVDYLIVSLHWGVENSFYQTSEQKALAHEIIDRGADMILGHHPHRTQGVEIYKGKPVFYSLGNFIFDQNIFENMQGFIMNMEFKDKKLFSLDATPYKIMDKSQIIPQTGLVADEMIKKEIELSNKLGTSCRNNEGKLVFDVK